MPVARVLLCTAIGKGIFASLLVRDVEEAACGSLTCPPVFVHAKRTTDETEGSTAVSFASAAGPRRKKSNKSLELAART